MQQIEHEEQGNSPSVRVENDRESIWTIPTKLKRWYFALFSIQVVIATAWIVRTAIADESVNGPSEGLLYLWQYLAPAAVASATFSLVIVDAANGIMVLSTWLEEVLEKRKQQQIKAAADSAAAEVQEAWLEWNSRRKAAAAAGEDFKEPPPGTSDNSSDF